MGINPIEYLVFPRVLAGILMLPILAMCFTVIATLSSCAIACGVMDLQYAIFWSQFFHIVDPIEVMHCVVKAGAFGLALTWIGCFSGFRAHGGALAVGQATRNTVVATCLAILLADYFLTSILPFGFKSLEVM